MTAACGNAYDPGATLVCTLPADHDGYHTMPTGDDDGVWVWEG